MPPVRLRGKPRARLAGYQRPRLLVEAPPPPQGEPPAWLPGEPRLRGKPQLWSPGELLAGRRQALPCLRQKLPADPRQRPLFRPLQRPMFFLRPMLPAWLPGKPRSWILTAGLLR